MKIETVEEFLKRGGFIKVVAVNKKSYDKQFADWHGKPSMYTKPEYKGEQASTQVKRKIKEMDENDKRTATRSSN